MPDPRKMQINLTGFLNGKYARMFMGELWAMLDSAQNSEVGGKYLAFSTKIFSNNTKNIYQGGDTHRPPQRQDGGAEGQEERGREAEGKFEETGG